MITASVSGACTQTSCFGSDTSQESLEQVTHLLLVGSLFKAAEDKTGKNPGL